MSKGRSKAPKARILVGVHHEIMLDNPMNGFTKKEKSQLFKSINLDGYLLQDLTGRSYLGNIKRNYANHYNFSTRQDI